MVEQKSEPEGIFDAYKAQLKDMGNYLLKVNPKILRNSLQSEDRKEREQHAKGTFTYLSIALQLGITNTGKGEKDKVIRALELAEIIYAHADLALNDREIALSSMEGAAQAFKIEKPDYKTMKDELDRELEKMKANEGIELPLEERF